MSFFVEWKGFCMGRAYVEIFYSFSQSVHFLPKYTETLLYFAKEARTDIAALLHTSNL